MMKKSTLGTHGWMKLPGLVIMDNEVFDDAKEKSMLGLTDEWNTWFGLVNLSFWMMEKSTFGIHGWMKYMAWFGQWSLFDENEEK